MSLTLLVAGAVAVPVGLVYAWIGRRFSHREVSRDAETAMVAFTAWWYGLAAYTLAEGVRLLLAGGGVLDVNVFVGLELMGDLFVSAALWGLLVYLIYLWRGRSSWTVPAVAGAYLGVFLVSVYLVTVAQPVGLDVGTWGVELAFASPPTASVEQVLLAIGTVPPILCALAYLSLYPRIDDPTRAYRILLVSVGVIAWFGSPLAAAATGLAQAPIWPLASRAIGLLAALVILAAYVPPDTIQQRWGVQPLGQAEPGST